MGRGKWASALAAVRALLGPADQRLPPPPSVLAKPGKSLAGTALFGQPRLPPEVKEVGIASGVAASRRQQPKELFPIEMEAGVVSVIDPGAAAAAAACRNRQRRVI